MAYGKILCRCVLADCVPMDGAFLEEMERHKTERLCGEYAPGRFAWMLENIEPLERPLQRGFRAWLPSGPEGVHTGYGFKNPHGFPPAHLL